MSPRMTAQDRREQLLDIASRLFSEHGYRATTTAQIAAGAKITEPTIYRHFEGKRELYLACVATAWQDVRARLESAVADEPDPAEWTMAMSRVGLATLRTDSRAQLWLQMHGEASGDEQVRDFAAQNLREVHAYIVGVISRAQGAGGVAADLDPEVEAWLFVSVALLVTTASRLGLRSSMDLQGIVAARQTWLRAGSGAT